MTNSRHAGFADAMRALFLPLAIGTLVFACVLPAIGVAEIPANVTFVGAKRFSSEQLRKALAEQLGEIATSGLTPARADDAAWFLGSFYRKQGFPRSEVTYEIRGTRLVLNVKEGVRAVIQSLTFEGNRAFPDKTLYEFMVGVKPERLAESKLPYHESEVQAGADRVRDFYASEGYLDATVDTAGTRVRSGGKHADLVVRIVEGTKYLLGGIAFTGHPVFERRELLEALAPKPGEVFTPDAVDEMQRNLRSFYRSRGYFAAKVTALADKGQARGARVPVTFECEPGVKFRIGKIEPRGMDRLSAKFMVKRFEPLAGKVYDPAQIEVRYRELIKTGMFKSLHVRPTPDGPDTLRLDVEVEEAKAREIGFELGYGSYDGVSFGVTIGDRNFLGYGRPLSLGVQYSERGLRGELLHVNPWLFDSMWTLRARLYSEDREEEGYSDFTNGIRLDLTRPVSPHWSAGAYVLGEATDITQSSIDKALIGPENYVLAAVGLTQTLDYRDDVMNPTRGWVFTTSADIDALDGRVAFARAAFRYSWYRSFGKTLLGFGARAGWIIPVGDGEPVPINLRYFNGGGTTVRSFAERQLGPKDQSGNPLGGEFYTVANLEWDFPIAGAFGGALFADAGSLLQDSTVSLDDMRYAIGAGLRYQLPIGPLRIDYGLNPNPKNGEKSGAFHLSFGFAF
jgi:outer membrane protein assembly complex protein YaeT